MCQARRNERENDAAQVRSQRLGKSVDAVVQWLFGERDDTRSQRRKYVEPLEPRWMLSGNPQPLTFKAVNPAGVQVYDAAAFGAVSAAGDSDSYQIVLNSAGKVSVVATPADTSMQLELTVSDDGTGNVLAGPVTASTQGASIGIQNVTLASGIYDVIVTEVVPVSGNFILDAKVNSFVQVGDPTNTTPNTALDLSGSSLTLAGGTQQFAAAGQGDSSGSPQFYKVNLTQGEFASAAMSGVTSASGKYGPVQENSVPDGTIAVAVGDLNGDGLMDIAAVGPDPGASDGLLTVLLNNGDGTYTSTQYNTPRPGLAVAIGAVNGDGSTTPDIIVGDGDSTGGDWTEFYGDGNGNFNSSSIVPDDQKVTAVAIADVNNDGINDVILGGTSTDGLSGHLGISITDTIGVGYYGFPPITGLATADFNGDGYIDVVASFGNGANGGGGIGVFLSSGPTNVFNPFPDTNTYDGGSTFDAVAVGDVNGDGTPDVVALYDGQDTSGNANVDVLEMNGDGSVASDGAAFIDAGQVNPGASLALGDFNGDGILDLIATSGPGGNLGGSDNNIIVASGTSPGQFGFNTTGYAVPDASGLAIADVTGDGRPDIVVASPDGSSSYGSGGVVDILPDSGPLSGGSGSLYVYMPDGSQLAAGQSGDDVASAVQGFIAPVSGTYLFAVIPAPNEQFALAVERGGAIGLYPEFFTGQGQNITGAKDVSGYLDPNTSYQYFEFDANPGDTISLNFTSPVGPGADASNPLSVGIQFDEPGDQHVIEFASNSLTYTVPAGGGGTYSMFLNAGGGAGIFDMQLTGETGTPTEVVNYDGTTDTHILQGPPTSIYISASHAISNLNVNLADFTMDGVAATSYAISGSAISVTFPSFVDTGDGNYTLNIASGAFTSLAGTPVTAFTDLINVDRGPRVIGSTLTGGDLLNPGSVTENLTFSKPLLVLIAEGTFGVLFLGPSAFLMQNLTTGQSFAPTTFQFGPQGNDYTDFTQVNLGYSNLPEGLYQLHLISGGFGGIQDQNNVALNGDYNGTLPSGDAYSGGDFLLNFTVDSSTPTAIGAPTPLAPLGSQAYAFTPVTSGAIDNPNDVDDYTISGQAGDQFSATIKATNYGLSPQVQLIAPGGAVLATATAGNGGTAVFQNISLPTTGVYTIEVTSLSGTGGTGGYIITPYLNLTLDSNDTALLPGTSTDTAQPLDFGDTDTGGATRAAVSAAGAATPQFYSLTLAAGQRISTALHLTSTTPPTSVSAGTLELLNSSGQVLAIGNATDPSNFILNDFAAPAAGTYYIQILTTYSYVLAVTKGTSIESEPNDTAAIAQDLSRTKQVTGYLSTGDSDNYTFTAAVGDSLILQTATPDDLGAGANGLRVLMTLYAPDGTLINSNQGGAIGDSHDARISYTVPAGGAGLYRVVLTQIATTTGAYTLLIAGATGAPVVTQPTVVNVTPTAAGSVATPPTSVTFTFSEAIDPNSVSASDLTIGSGATVASVTIIDGKTIQFILNVPNIDQFFFYSLAAGAFTSLQGQPSAPYSSYFHVDKTGPYVVGQDPGSNTTAPFTTWTFTFVEPLAPLQQSFASSNLIASFTGPGGTNLIYQINSIQTSGTTLTITFLPQNVAGSYTMVLAPGFTDLVGNQMDQNHNQVNGETPGDDYSTTTIVGSPDLQVTSIQPATGAVFGAPNNVTWTVTNTGTADATGSWADDVYLSTTGVFDSTAVFLGRFTRPNTLAAGASYTTTQAVTFPLNNNSQAGTEYIIVVTNLLNTQLEGNTNNNVTTTQDTITLPTLVDLAESNITAPLNLASGQTGVLNWTLSNFGAKDFTGTLQEILRISSDNAVGSDTDLLLVTFTGTIPAGQSVPRTATITVPQGTAGQFWFVVVADPNGQVFEHGNTANNSTITASPTNIALTPEPDLIATNISAPGAVFTGNTVTITWTDSNQGSADFDGSFTDTIGLSTDPAGQSNIQDFIDITFSGPIVIGGSIQRTATFTLPANFPAGNYYPVIQVDATNAVYENPSGEANNRAIGATAIGVTVPALPDLTVSNVQTPVQATAGQSVAITWTITNTGTGTATGPWQDNIFLSTDAAGQGLLFYLQYQVVTNLAPGASITLTQNIKLPETLTGTYYVAVQTNATGALFESNSNNDLGVSATAFTVTPALYPDLVVSNVNAPNSGFSGQQAQVTWFVTNSGTGATTASAWYDNVYISTQQTYDPSAKLLGTFLNPSYLAAGQGYQNTATVTLPVGIQGTYYFIIIADANGNVDEFGPGGESNNYGSGNATQVTLTPPPDLRVASLSAPSQAFSGQPLSVGWDVKNFGPGPTILTESQWTDIVYLSTDATLDSNDTQLATVTHTGGLAVGQDYLSAAGIVLPRGISGNYYLLVFTDGFSQVTEAGFEGNNVGITPIAITLTPPPDLAVSSLIAPAAVISGHTLSVPYSVTNEGASTTPNTSWGDFLYLSQTEVVDSSAILIGQFGHYGQLAAGDSYSAVLSGTVPANLPSGTYYAIVVTDAGQQVFELNRGNNTRPGSNATIVTYSPPDLVVSSLTSPGSAASGGGFLASWTVKNQGTGDTAIGSWGDYVYLSSDTILGDGDDLLLGTYEHYGLLAPGASYASGNQSVVIPSTIPAGNYYLLVLTDAGQGVYEGPGGSAAELNNASTAQPITITHTVPDLQVTSVGTLANATQGGTSTVSWSVVNAGNGSTAANFWYDNVYISPVPSLNGNSVLLAQVQHSNALGAGGSYSNSAMFTIPSSLAVGTYYIVVLTDSQNFVNEPGNEGNNVTAGAAFTLGAGAEPNLAVSTITVPTAATSGQPVTVSYTVSNNGTAQAFGSNGTWYDIAYLSLDQNLDPQTDITLGYNLHSGALNPGASYTDTVSYGIPAGLTGSYYVIVVNDVTKRVTNDTNLADNTSVSASKIAISTPAPTDIALGTVTLPTPAVGGLGQNISITYTVQNLSGVAAIGTWQDTLYLSTTPNYSAAAVPLGTLTHFTGLAAGNSYTATLTAAVPGVNPGNYYIIVRTDIRNVLPETTKANNISASLGTVILSLATLTVGTPATGTLSIGQSIYYQVTVPYGQTLYVTFNSDQPFSSNELYIRHGQVPTRSTFDQEYTNPLSANQSITVPFTLAGTYYILAYGSSVSDAENYTLAASLPQFSVNDTNYGVGGTAGQRTIQINGAKFDRTDTATLTHNGVAVASAVSYYYVTQSRFYATFDLTHVAPGTYDLTFGNSAGGSAVVPNSFQVVAGGGANVQATLNAPGNVRHNVTYSFSADYSNSGINDALSPLLVVTGTTLIGQVPGFRNSNAYTFFAPAPGDGPPGILMPGTTGSQIFFSNIGASNETLTLGKYATDPTQPFDYSAIASQLVNSNETTAAFNAAFARMQQDIGPTIGDVLKALAADANVANIVDSGIITESELLSVNMNRARAELTTSISGVINAPDMSIAVADKVLTATNNSTGEIFATVTLKDGSFVFSSLTPGSYTFVYEGGIVENNGSGVILNGGQHLANLSVKVDAGATFGAGVSDASNGAAIAGAIVHAIGSDGTPYIDITDANGDYSFSGIPNDTYSIYVDAGGYARSSQTFTTALGTNPNSFTLAAASTASGTVLLPNDNNGDLSVSATLVGSTSPANVFHADLAGGHFSFSDLPVGTYTLVINQVDSVVVTQSFTITAPGTVLDLGTFTIVDTAAVTGGVTAADSTFSLEGLTVEVLSTSNNSVAGLAATDTDGSFQIGQLAPGSYLLHIANLYGGYADDVPFTVIAGQTLSGESLHVRQGDSIGGTVLLNGSPAVGVAVSLVSGGGVSYTFVTNSTGVYGAKHLAPGTYTLSVPGLAPIQVVLPATDGSSVTQNLSVSTQVATISGVLSVNGSPISGDVSLFSGGQLVSIVDTNSSGAYSVTVALAGTYDLVASANDASFFPASVSVVAGATVTHNFTAGTGSVAITAVDSTAPISGEMVYLQFESASDGPVDVAYQAVDASGLLTIGNLVPGTYRAWLVSMSGVISPASIVSVGASTANILLAVNAGDIALSGTVTAVIGGAAINNATILFYSVTNGVATQVGISFSDAQGNYALSGVAAGMYDVVVSAAGMQTVVDSGVTVSSGGTLNLSLSPATSAVTGNILDANGIPVAGASISITNAKGEVLGSATSGPDGSFAISGVSGVNLTLNISGNGYKSRLVAVASVPTSGAFNAGNLTITFVAYAGTTPEAASSPTLPALSSANSPALIALSPSSLPGGITVTPNFSASDAGFYLVLITKLSSYSADPDAVSESQVPPVDVCGHTAALRARTIKDIQVQDALFQDAQNFQGVARSDLFFAAAGFALDVAQVAGVIAQLVLAGEALAALAAYGLVGAGVEVTAAEVTAGIDSVGALGLGSTRYGFQIANAIGGFVSSLAGLKDASVALGSSSTPQTAIDNLQNTGNLFSNFVGLIQNLAGLVKLEVETLGVYAKVGAIGALNTVYQTLVGGETLIHNLTLQDAIPSLQNLVGALGSFDNADAHYHQYVRRANNDLTLYLSALQFAKDDCNGQGNTNNTTTTSKTITFPPGQDPNAISGPVGFGPANYTSSALPLGYQIQFENDPDAPGNVQVVKITEQLSSNLDFRTFRLGTMDVGGTVVSPPAGSAFYQARIDLTATLGVDMDVFAGVDVATGQAFWTFTAIDPATGEQPVNPLMGILPPDIISPQGEGFVSYTISPLSTAVSGAVIQAAATVLFDDNAPIDTPTVSNTLDNVAPTSSVSALPPSSGTDGINLSWSGTDDANGSGIAGFTIYVSINGGDYTPWLSNTTATSAVYAGTVGQTYRFYSLATDNVGNTEIPPVSAQATTTVGGASATLSGLAGNTTITYGTGTATFTGTVLGSPLAGEIVAVTLNGTTVNATLDGSGNFSATFDTSELSASPTPYVVTYSYAGDTSLGGVSDTTSTTLTVNKATIIVTVGDATKVYGAADPTFGVGYGGFVNGDSQSALSGTLSYLTNEPSTGNANVGSYSITASGLSSSNYIIQYVAGSLSVTPASLTITANTVYLGYGQPIPTLSAGYNGFVGGDTAASLTTLPTLGTTATSTSAVGSYAITINGAVDPNYTITYVPGTLAITQVTPAIVLTPPPTLVYDGTADVLSWATATLTGAGNGAADPTGPISYTFYTGTTATGTPLASPPINPGTYTVIASYGGDANYTAVQTSATFTITQATPTLVLNAPPPTLIYDGTGDVLSWVTATLSGAGNGATNPTGPISYTYYAGSTATGTPLVSPPINAGTYTVVANYSGDANYTAAQTSATFTIANQNALLGASIQIDDGTAQRSMVRSIKVTFTSAVSVGAGAITLVDSNGIAVPFTQNTTDGITYTLTFSGTGGSLPDGRYTLVLHANAINTSGGPKFDFDHAMSFWRLFGDFYGTGTVSNADKTLYTQAYKGQSPATVPYADYDANQTLNSVDTNAFSANLGKSEVAPTQNLNTIGGTAGVDTIVLTLDADHQHIDWSMSSTNGGYTSGQMIAGDPAGLTINGNGGTDVIELNFTNGNPLPSVMHLNGTFFVDGLVGTDPLAGKTLDINQSTVYLTYANTADPLAMIQNYLRTGYNGGDWNGAGNGVITSTAASQDATRSTGIGYVDSARGLIPGLPADTIELKYTLYGDTGLTGSVGFTDFMRMTQHFTTTQYGSWAAGDFNYDGSVDTSDFNLLKANYGASLPASAPAAVSSTTTAPTTTTAPATTTTVTPTPKTTTTVAAPPAPVATPVTAKPTTPSTGGQSSGSTATTSKNSKTKTPVSTSTKSVLKTPAMTSATIAKAPVATTSVVPAPKAVVAAVTTPATSKFSSTSVSTAVAAKPVTVIVPPLVQPKKPANPVASKIAELISAMPSKDDKVKPTASRKKK